MLNDLLSDGLTRIRNGFMSGKRRVAILRSKLVSSVVDILIKEGYLLGMKEEGNLLHVDLRYAKNGAPALIKARRISKGGCRIYVPCRGYKKMNAYSVLVLSTNRGVLTDMDANRAGIGGEVLLEVF